MLGSTESAVNRLNESYAELTARKEKLGRLIKQAEEEYQAKKKESEEIVKKMREETQEELDEKRSQVMVKAHKEAEKILADTMSATERIRQEIRKEEQMYTVDRSEELLSASLGEMFGERIDAMLIDDFIEEFKEMDKSNISPSVEEVVLVTRAALKEEEKNNIVKTITEKTGRNFTFEEKTDPGIVGGIILKFGSLTLDGSVAGKLKDASVKIKQNIEQTK